MGKRRCDTSNYTIFKPTLYPVGGSSNISISYNLSGSVSLKTDSMSTCQNIVAVDGDSDCYKLSSWNNVSTFSLLYENNLEAYCSNFPKSGRLCLPQTCSVYQVQKNDTCSSIIQKHHSSFTATQLKSWNPNINKPCSNLGQLENSYICIR